MKYNESLNGLSKDLRWVFDSLKNGDITPAVAKGLKDALKEIRVGYNDKRMHHLSIGDNEKMSFYYD